MTLKTKKMTNEDKHSFVYYKKYIEPNLKTSEILQRKLKDAFDNNNWNLMKKLLDQGAYINYRYDPSGTTLMFHCTTSESIKELRDLGADINAKDKNGQSVIGHALYTDWSKDLIKLLLKLGANINVQGPYGHSPLYYAVQHQKESFELLKLMMQYKANINGVDKYTSYSPIERALFYRDFAKIMIKYGLFNNGKTDWNIDLRAYQRRIDTCEYEYITKYLEECISEVTLMKQEFVYEKTTLWNYLNLNRNRRLKLQKSVDLTKYPVYADLIQEIIDKKANRKDLLNNLKAVYCNTPHGKEIKLNYDSTYEITNYLDNDDIQNLITALTI